MEDDDSHWWVKGKFMYTGITNRLVGPVGSQSFLELNMKKKKNSG